MPSWKRATDIGGASLALLILAPVMLVVGLLVRAFLGSPVFFLQTRPGLRGRPFQLVKFRTMRGPGSEPEREMSDQDRLTTFGRALRATSLDELPEFWNVLRGDMSLVGPRPLLIEYLPLYSTEQARRHEVRPGITGWAQVHGRNDTTWAERLQRDVWYVDHQSPGLDARILAMTVIQVVLRRGISQPGAATMEKFRGNADSIA